MVIPAISKGNCVGSCDLRGAPRAPHVVSEGKAAGRRAEPEGQKERTVSELHAASRTGSVN